MAPQPGTFASSLVSGEPIDVARARAKQDAAAKIDPLRPPSPCARRGGDACPFLEPDRATLDELARCGIVRIDNPRFLDKMDTPTEFPEAWVELTGLTPEEQRTLEAVGAAFKTELRASATELAVEGGMDREWADTSPLFIVIGMVEQQFDDDGYAQALQDIARERAGQQDPPAEDAKLSLAQRTARLFTSAADAFESAVAKELGTERAHELRAADDGWHGRKTTLGNRCKEPEPEAKPTTAKVPSTTEEAKACIAGRAEGDCRFLAPPKVELEEMSRCGIVRFDFPAFLMTRSAEPTFDAAFADAVGLTPLEEAKIAETVEAFREKLYADVTAMVIEVGKTQVWADQTPLMGLMLALHEEVGEDETSIEEIFRRIARERAGQQEPAPTDNIHERFIRRVTELGPELEAALAQQLGPARAAALRTHGDGWPGNRVQTASRCDEE